MLVLVVVGVLIPAVTILSAVVWGAIHGTLAETPQDRYDWDFEQIVRRI